MTTTRYGALLRGINVGGSRKVPMAALRDVLNGLGHRDVVTYLQSGNAVFTDTTGADESTLAAALGDAINDRFGFAVDCLVRDAAYLKAVADACPFPAATLQAKQLHVTYLSGSADPGRFAAIDQESYRPEEFRIGDRALYLYVPDGLGRSKLGAALSRPGLYQGMVATSRNWNTVTKLVELTHD